MESREQLLKEITSLPTEELELIIETQKDNYNESEKEMLIKELNSRLALLEEKRKVQLPSEIVCPKCDGKIHLMMTFAGFAVGNLIKANIIIVIS